MATGDGSLRAKQVLALKQTLNLNEPIITKEYEDHSKCLPAESELVWKILVFDDLGRDVVSSVLRVSDLRALGVTLHCHISSSRHRIEDAPAVYLIEPTATNLKTITNDLRQSLYSPVYINFLSSVPRPFLEDFASETANAGTSKHIAKVFDQYLNFIVSEPDVFSLGMEKEHTYWALNSAKTKDEELDHVIDRVTSGLFSVMVTMGVIPIIRCPKGGASEMIAQKLDRKLRDYHLNSPKQATASSSTSRPVLVILDRNLDLLPMLSHSSNYQSLIYDVLTMHLNRITIEDKGPKGPTKKSYDLASNDFFWAKNANMPFPEVAEDIDAELTKYKEEASEITRKTGVSALEDLQDSAMAQNARHLKTALALLPELRERKTMLDMHMNILEALLRGIEARQLGNYLRLEENVVKQTKPQVLEIIRAEKQGDDPMDKLRLFYIWFLSTEQDVSKGEWTQFEEALEKAGADTTSMAYIRQVRATTKMTQLTTINNQPQASSTTGDLFGRFSSISSRLTERLKETGVSTNLSANFDTLISGVKNFLPANRDLTITKIVESIMDPAAASSSAIAKTEIWLYFDPRNAHARGTMPPPSAQRSAGGVASAPGGLPGAAVLGAAGTGTGAFFAQKRQGFSDAIVFTVGGGSVDECGNLSEWAARTGGERNRRRIVYGSTEILSASQFVSELERLGREI